MEITNVSMETLTTEYPNEVITLSHDGHTIITDWRNCRRTPAGRIDWKKSLNKDIPICRDGVVRVFEIIEYIEKPSDTAHDAKIKVRNKDTKEEFPVWSRDFKQGDIAKLFK